MFQYYVILKGTNKQLAIEELTSLSKVFYEETPAIYEIENTFYSLQLTSEITEKDTFLSRLTLTNYIGKLLFSSPAKEFKQHVLDADIPFDSSKSFSLRIKKAKRSLEHPISERECAGLLHDKFAEPRVDLENPDVEFNILVKEVDEVALCQKLYENDKEYLRRMPKQRPIQMPYTLKSDMARACINLLELKDGIILDPFCGIGGITLEAYDMGFDCIGNDISWNDLKYYKQNIQHFFPNIDPKRTLVDSRTCYLREGSVQGIVTDIPYGKASRKLGLDLYEDFLISARQMLVKGGRIVVIFANFVEFRDLAKQYFTEVVKIDQYINRSMTRHILVLENSKDI